ncbi:MAG: DUF2851 family protein [Muribaculaceae bacterium]|nr:DUF2851 family protein [Muribaculaceae bacterium]MCI9053903.1 DUF2851 family protein [Muribaculaceae bacterium]
MAGAEMLLQYLWEHRLWDYGSLKTIDGRRVNVIDQGRRNQDSGPDFFNAKIEIDGHIWAGNVEIHVRASDWHRHGHHADRAYDSVILHVVGHSDAEVRRPDGQPIPQLELPYTPDYRSRYDAMVNNTVDRLACSRHLYGFSPIHITDWITALGHERLYAKVERVNSALGRLDGDWQAAAYVTLARALGFSTNSDAFERVAYATPLRCLLKHRSDRRLLEATLFGQAGFLATAGNDPEHPGYVDDLRADYGFMKAKYGLSAPESPGWKMARMRPPNLPHRRIAALAAIIADGFRFGSAFSHVTNQADARNLFTTEITGYWATHYTFGPSSAYVPRAFSPDSVTSLIINAVVPLLYAYGVYFGDDSKTAAAVELLQSLPPENNSVTRIFTDQGIPCDDAFSSQALIQLRRAYCEPRKCLYCRIGHRILASKAKP